MTNLDRKAIVTDENTLGVVINGKIQILRASVLKGSPHPELGFIDFCNINTYRLATEKDFADYRISFHSDYI